MCSPGFWRHAGSLLQAGGWGETPKHAARGTQCRCRAAKGARAWKSGAASPRLACWPPSCPGLLPALPTLVRDCRRPARAGGRPTPRNPGSPSRSAAALSGPRGPAGTPAPPGTPTAPPATLSLGWDVGTACIPGGSLAPRQGQLCREPSFPCPLGVPKHVDPAGRPCPNPPACAPATWRKGLCRCHRRVAPEREVSAAVGGARPETAPEPPCSPGSAGLRSALTGSLGGGCTSRRCPSAAETSTGTCAGGSRAVLLETPPCPPPEVTPGGGALGAADGATPLPASGAGARPEHLVRGALSQSSREP